MPPPRGYDPNTRRGPAREQPGGLDRLPCTAGISPTPLVFFAAARADISPARGKGSACARRRGFEGGAGTEPARYATRGRAKSDCADEPPVVAAARPPSARVCAKRAPGGAARALRRRPRSRLAGPAPCGGCAQCRGFESGAGTEPARAGFPANEGSAESGVGARRERPDGHGAPARLPCARTGASPALLVLCAVARALASRLHGGACSGCAHRRAFPRVGRPTSSQNWRKNKRGRIQKRGDGAPRASAGRLRRGFVVAVIVGRV